MTDSARRTTLLAAAAIGAAFVVVVIASLASGGGGGAGRSSTDGAFIAGMVPHHASAVEMSRIALERSERAPVKRLAQNIIDSQTQEMSVLRSIHQRLYGAALSTMSNSHGEMPGMSGGAAMTPAQLKAAPDFDRAFLDAMVAHHGAAVQMARRELAKGADAELKQIARAVIATQSREISMMRQWRAKWYGAA